MARYAVLSMYSYEYKCIIHMQLCSVLPRYFHMHWRTVSGSMLSCSYAVSFITSCYTWARRCIWPGQHVSTQYIAHHTICNLNVIYETMHFFIVFVAWMKQQLLPTWTTMIDQIQLAQGSIFMYAGLPVFSEWLIEEGYTRVYYRYIPAYAVYVYFFVIHIYTVTYLLQFV